VKTTTFGLILVGALVAFEPVSAKRLARADDVAPVNSRTLERLGEIARDYAKAGKVDDMRRWAPYLCNDPGPPAPRVSTDHDGKKLYFVYANDRDAYVKNESASGQWVVKESFVDEKKSNLFLMLRVDFCRSAPEYSDDGWVYATATPEGRILQAGKIVSCARCHRLAEHERLFGLDHAKLDQVKKEKP
jgi:hypothetical protein